MVDVAHGVLGIDSVRGFGIGWELLVKRTIPPLTIIQREPHFPLHAASLLLGGCFARYLPRPGVWTIAYALVGERLANEHAALADCLLHRRPVVLAVIVVCRAADEDLETKDPVADGAFGRGVGDEAGTA